MYLVDSIAITSFLIPNATCTPKCGNYNTIIIITIILLMLYVFSFDDNYFDYR